MTDAAHAPKQQRSRETQARLLEATIEVLEEHGLAGATIPRIAAVAKVAPASVYRRFPDKESLFRAAFLNALERSNDLNAAAIPALIKERTLDWVGAAFARTMIVQYRAHPKLMRAMIRFTENDTDEAFKARAMSLVVANTQMVVETIASDFRDEIKHEDARRAVTFAALAIATIAEVRALEDFSLWHEMLPISDDHLQAELKHLFLAYLRTPTY